MKKVLYASTAIAAAGLLSLASNDAFAQSAAPAAAQKLQVGVGGYMIQTIGYADQTGTTGAISRKHFDQHSDSELYFKGAINLDNGLTVALNVELETDPEQTTNVDESYLTIGSADVGSLYMGDTNAASFYLGVSAPWSGLNFFDGTLNGWVVAPASFATGSSSGSTTSSGATDWNRIEYISPSIAGFRIGGGYAPSSTASQTLPLVTESDYANASIQWAPGDLGGFKPRLYAGWWRVNDTHALTTDTYSGGADVTIGDWIIGGGYAKYTNTHDTFLATADQAEGTVWNAGIKYAPGPFSVAFTYGGSSSEQTDSVAANDKLNRFALGADYILGPGVSLVGDLTKMIFVDQANAGQNVENNGWAAIGGIRLDF